MKHRYHVAYQYTSLNIPQTMGFGSTEITYDDMPNVSRRLLGLMRQSVQETLVRDHSGTGGFGIVILNVMPLVIEEDENPFGIID